ncbi:MAG TPA: cysteine--tRNA ligase [Acidimicrobiia bacterium]
MRVFSTLHHGLVELEPRRSGAIGMYVCGATLQSRPHLGHGRYAVVFDVLRRYLEWLGIDVTYVRNITDIDDKIIAAAEERDTSIDVVVAESAEAFSSAYRSLRVLAPTIEPRATEHVPEMVDLIDRLIAAGHAYESGGDVYFSVRSYPDYGKLSGRNVDELRSGARVELGELKRDPLDFALWKAAKPGEPKWESPWGPGRPGWHIECSAMARSYLGDGFDIHGGGGDLVFPHHENEVAQSEAAMGTRFARYWMHNGMVNLAGEKMSKSTGHVIDLLEALEKYRPVAVRLFYLRTHYRRPLDFTEEALADAESSLERLWSFRRRTPGPVEDEPSSQHLAAFREAMDDDLDVAGALAVLFDLVRDGNRAIDDGGDAAALTAAYDEIASVLGIEDEPEGVVDLADALSRLALDVGVAAPPEAEATIEALLARRALARADRDFATADAIRDGLAEVGIVATDTVDGTRWHRS